MKVNTVTETCAPAKLRQQDLSCGEMFQYENGNAYYMMTTKGVLHLARGELFPDVGSKSSLVRRVTQVTITRDDTSCH